jgi:hypothetical protein
LIVEESAGLTLGRFARMAFAMEKGKTPDPLAISFSVLRLSCAVRRTLLI